MSSRFSALNFGYVAFAVTSSRFFISIPPLFIRPPKRAPYPSSSSIRSAVRTPKASAILCSVPMRGFGDGPSTFSIPLFDTADKLAKSRMDNPFFVRISRTRRRIFITRYYNNRRHKRYASAMSRLYHKYCPTLGGQM